MGGGNWTEQNKVLPDTYINYSGEGPTPSVTGKRGTVGLPITFPWLPEQSIVRISSKEVARLYDEFGEPARLIREAAKKAAVVCLFRLNKGTKATAVLGDLTATALYSGTHGNGFSLSIESAVGQEGKFHVVTWRGSVELERQLVDTVDMLKNNAWIVFSQTANGDTLTASAGTPLTGGANSAVTSADHVAALQAFEMQQLGAIACPSAEADIKALYISFAKRMVSEEGNYLQVVVADSMTADFEGVISLKNGVMLEDTTVLSNVMATAYVAGATAGCPLAESLTNAAYEGAVDVDSRYTRTQQEDFARSGQMVFLPPAQGGTQPTIQKDINTLMTFTKTKTYALSKNKIIRTLFYICIAITGLGNQYKGVMANNEDGRAQLKASVLELFRDLEKKSVLREVSPDDITVEPGTLIDAVTISYVIRPVDVMETFYNSIVVNG